MHRSLVIEPRLGGLARVALRSITALGLALGALGCGQDTAVTVELARVAPAADPGCGAPVDAQTLVVTALGDFPASELTATSQRIGPDGRIAISSFPLDTRVLRVEVLGNAGALRTVGKSAPFDLAALAPGHTVPIFMAPPRGVCPTGPPALARIGPLVARAGPGALVAGGVDTSGAPVTAIERYVPATGAFEVAIEDHYGAGEHGLVGASMTALEPPGAPAVPPGERPARVVIAGGGVPAYQVYDPLTGALSAALFLAPGRAFHAAVALDDHRLLVAGGCSPLTAEHTCAPASALLSTSIIDVDAHEVRDGPALARPRIGGVAVREDRDSVLLIGGTDEAGAPVDAIERIYIDALDGRPGELVAMSDMPGAGAAAGLAAGGVVVAFAPGGERSARAGVLAPGRATLSSAADAPWPLAGASLTPLQDGRVLAVGARADDDDGADAGALLLYEPSRAGFRALAPSLAAPLPGRDHGAALLDDGTVLIVGGRPGAGAQGDPDEARAWIVRPDLTGPYTSDVAISFSDDELAQHLIPRDPDQVARVPAQGAAAARYVITSSGVGGGLPSEWAVIAGPVFSQPRMTARVRALDDSADSAGVALLFGFDGARSFMTAVLIAGQAATLYRLDHDAVAVVDGCDSEVITAAMLAPGDESAEMELAVDGATVSVHVDGAQVLRCAVEDGQVPAGLVGVGVVGASGAAVGVEFLSARR